MWTLNHMIPNSFFENLKNLAPTLVRNYKPIIGSAIGAYLLGKILLPNNLHEYLSWKKQKEGMSTHSDLLSMIEKNTRDNSAAVPKKDNYIYTF